MTQRTFANSGMIRRKWLGSGSVLAAVIALTSVPAEAQAQVRPGLGGGIAPSVGTIRHRVSANNASDAARLPQRAPVEIRVDAPGSLPGAMRSPAALPNSQVRLPNSQANAVAPSTGPQVSITSAPTIPTVSVPQTVSVQQSSAPATTSVNPPPGDPGVAVRAFADFNDADIIFTPGLVATPGAATDLVDVRNDGAIITWTTFDAGVPGTDVTFLGSGNTLAFTSPLNGYTVLNRIATPNFDSAVLINGSVTSDPVGSIWFYSSGGLILGPDASFDVGSLLLSTSAIGAADVSSDPFDVTFLGTPNTASAIRIDSNASITASSPDSYVAMVAPRIEQNGTINANGSTALVAAEQARMTIRNNLFDIEVTVGSEDTNGIVHGATASTGGVGSTGVTDEQAIYFVAVPKNDAITMLVSGNVGYQPAASAAIENGQVILTTGSRVERTQETVRVNTQDVEISRNTVDTSVDGGPAGNITIEDTSFTSFTQVFAGDTVTLQAGVSDPFDAITATGGLSGINLDATAGNSVELTITGEGRIEVSGSLNITSGDGDGVGGNVTANIDQNLALSVPLGGLVIGSDLNISTTAQGRDDLAGAPGNGGTGIGEDGVAGDIIFNVFDQGFVSVGGGLRLDASANGGSGDVRAGSSTGGDITFSMSSGDLSAQSGIVFDARGKDAGTGLLSGLDGPIGSSSAAGDVRIDVTGGFINTGTVDVRAGAEATGGTDEQIVQSNDAAAGNFVLNVSGGFHNLEALFVDLSAETATSFSAPGISTSGQATRGTAEINVTNPFTALSINDNLSITTEIQGNAPPPVGDTISIRVTDTGTNFSAGLNIGGTLILETPIEAGGRDVLGKGGNISVVADNGALTAGSLDIFASASGSPFLFFGGQTGTDFTGGDVSLLATNDGLMDFAAFNSIRSNATGAVSSNSTGRGIGQGGTVTLLADNGTINFGGLLEIDANGFALSGVNSGGVPAEGRGGIIRISVDGPNGDLAFDTLEAGTDGSFTFDGEFIDTFFIGMGSGGIGGLTEFNVLGGTLTAIAITTSSDGEGGPGGEISDGSVSPTNGKNTTGDGGAGIGGEVTFNLNGGTAILDDLTVSSTGVGGEGAFGSSFENNNGGTGGDAVGGTATFNALSGSLTVNDTLSVESNGNRQSSGNVFGGRGGTGETSEGGDGGSARGGDAIFNLTGTATIDATEVIISTAAFGGEGGESFTFSASPDQGGGRGGDATGGTALFNDTAGDIVFGTLLVDSGGTGGEGGRSRSFGQTQAVGDGGNGGTGTGGTSIVSLNQDDAVRKSYTVRASGVGGLGGEGNFAGMGGAGFGGVAQIAVNNVDVAFDSLVIEAQGTGGMAGSNNGADIRPGNDGGAGTGGSADLQVAGANAAFNALGTIALRAGAVGGTGAEGTESLNDFDPSSDGGDGGGATGGSATISVIDSALVTIDAPQFLFDADAVGGDGGAGDTHEPGDHH